MTGRGSMGRRVDLAYRSGGGGGLGGDAGAERGGLRASRLRCRGAASEAVSAFTRCRCARRTQEQSIVFGPGDDAEALDGGARGARRLHRVRVAGRRRPARGEAVVRSPGGRGGDGLELLLEAPGPPVTAPPPGLLRACLLSTSTFETRWTARAWFAARPRATTCCMHARSARAEAVPGRTISSSAHGTGRACSAPWCAAPTDMEGPESSPRRMVSAPRGRSNARPNLSANVARAGNPSRAPGVCARTPRTGRGRAGQALLTPPWVFLPSPRSASAPSTPPTCGRTARTSSTG